MTLTQNVSPIFVFGLIVHSMSYIFSFSDHFFLFFCLPDVISSGRARKIKKYIFKTDFELLWISHFFSLLLLCAKICLTDFYFTLHECLIRANF